MKMKFEKIREMLTFAHWMNEYDELENPNLLAASCMAIAASFCDEDFNAKDFAKEVMTDSLVKELLRVSFYFTLAIKKETKRLTKEENILFEKEKTNEILKYWSKMSKDIFCFSSPIFDEETFWNVITSESFSFIDYCSITFPEMFATMLVYAMPKEMTNWVMEVLKTVLSYCTDSDAKYMSENYPTYEKYKIPTRSVEKFETGDIFEEKTTLCTMVCIKKYLRAETWIRQMLILNRPSEHIVEF